MSTSAVAAIGNGAAFGDGGLCLLVGVVPRQYSTGGKQTLLGISKRGNLSLGAHRITVKGWDSSGAFSSTANVTVQ